MLREEKIKARNKEKCYFVSVPAYVTQVAQHSLASCHFTTTDTTSMPVRQGPTGTFGIRWQIHNTRQQHDLVLDGPTQTQ